MKTMTTNCWRNISRSSSRKNRPQKASAKKNPRGVMPNEMLREQGSDRKNEWTSLAIEIEGESWLGIEGWMEGGALQTETGGCQRTSVGKEQRDRLTEGGMKSQKDWLIGGEMKIDLLSGEGTNLRNVAKAGIGHSIDKTIQTGIKIREERVRWIAQEMIDGMLEWVTMTRLSILVRTQINTIRVKACATVMKIRLGKWGVRIKQMINIYESTKRNIGISPMKKRLGKRVGKRTGSHLHSSRSSSPIGIDRKLENLPKNNQLGGKLALEDSRTKSRDSKEKIDLDDDSSNRDRKRKKRTKDHTSKGKKRSTSQSSSPTNRKDASARKRCDSSDGNLSTDESEGRTEGGVGQGAGLRGGYGLILRGRAAVAVGGEASKAVCASEQKISEVKVEKGKQRPVKEVKRWVVLFGITEIWVTLELSIAWRFLALQLSDFLDLPLFSWTSCCTISDQIILCSLCTSIRRTSSVSCKSVTFT